MGAIRRIAQELLVENVDEISSTFSAAQRMEKGIGYRQVMAKLGEGHERKVGELVGPHDRRGAPLKYQRGTSMQAALAGGSDDPLPAGHGPEVAA